MKSEQTKANIIRQTIILIDEYNGDTSKIAVREIAERAHIAYGLINHYFDSKEHLIKICVRQIIDGVVKSFNIENCGKTSNGFLDGKYAYFQIVYIRRFECTGRKG